MFFRNTVHSNYFHFVLIISGITFYNVDGTGPHGRILKGDVINYMKENNIEQIKPKLINFETKTGILCYVILWNAYIIIFFAKYSSS